MPFGIAPSRVAEESGAVRRSTAPYACCFKIEGNCWNGSPERRNAAPVAPKGERAEIKACYAHKALLLLADSRFQREQEMSMTQHPYHRAFLLLKLNDCPCHCQIPIGKLEI